MDKMGQNGTEWDTFPVLGLTDGDDRKEERPLSDDTTKSSAKLRRDELASQVVDLVILEHMTIRDAAKKVGIARSTWYYWTSTGKISHILTRAGAEVKERSKIRWDTLWR